MMRILFICSGNTSRSPMAEGIFRQMVSDVEISSAGFSTFSGERASRYAILACKKHGIDLSGFRTTNISDVDFNEIDLALTATESARDKIMRLYPNVEAYTIREYSGEYEDLDIKDPSEDSLGDHVVCFFEIKEALEKILEKHEELEGVDMSMSFRG